MHDIILIASGGFLGLLLSLLKDYVRPKKMQELPIEYRQAAKKIYNELYANVKDITRQIEDQGKWFEKVDSKRSIKLTKIKELLGEVNNKLEDKQITREEALKILNNIPGELDEYTQLDEEIREIEQRQMNKKKDSNVKR